MFLSLIMAICCRRNEKAGYFRCLRQLDGLYRDNLGMCPGNGKKNRFFFVLRWTFTIFAQGFLNRRGFPAED